MYLLYMGTSLETTEKSVHILNGENATKINARLGLTYSKTWFVLGMKHELVFHVAMP